MKVAPVAISEREQTATIRALAPKKDGIRIPQTTLRNPGTMAEWSTLRGTLSQVEDAEFAVFGVRRATIWQFIPTELFEARSRQRINTVCQNRAAPAACCRCQISGFHVNVHFGVALLEFEAVHMDGHIRIKEIGRASCRERV